MKIEKWNLYVMIICFILGFLISLDFKTQHNLKKSTSIKKVEKLKIMLDNQKKYNQSLIGEHQKLQNILSNFSFNKKNNFQNAKNKKEEQILTGSTAVKGAGVIIILNDSLKKPKATENLNLYLIHDNDLLNLVNELWASEAKAISINNQRIIFNSEINCAGPNISINKIKIVPPFVIKAIGNPEILTSSLNFPGGIMETLKYFSKQFGIRVKLLKKNKIIIPKLSNKIYAKLY